MNIFIFILLIILLVLSAVLIVLSSKNNYIKNGGNNAISNNAIRHLLTAAQLYELVHNTNTNVAISIFKLNDNKIIVEHNNFSNFHIQDARIGIFTYGRGEALIGNIDILLHILLQIDSYLRIAIIGNQIVFKAKDSEMLLALLDKHLPPPLKKIESNDGVHILSFKQALEYDPVEETIAVLIQKITDQPTSNTNLMYKFMSIFTGQKEDQSKNNIIGGAESYEIELSPYFLSEFEKRIENTYSEATYDNIQEESPSLYNRFMYALIENNRNVELTTEKPHTEKMQKGTIYFLPKRRDNIDISVFSKLGIDNYTNIPLGEYYINNSQNVIKIE